MVRRGRLVKRLVAIGGFIVIALLIAMAGYAADYCYPNGTLKIGVTGPFTGNVAAEGKEFIDGATLAVEELNASGGVMGYKVELLVRDVGSDYEPGTITSVYEKLINADKVDAIFTGYTSHTQFEIEICKEYEMVYMIAGDAMSTEAIIGAAPEKYPTVWNIVPSYLGYRTELPKRMDKWAAEGSIELPNRKVAIITSDNAYSRYISEGLKETFTSLGWEITVDEMVPPITVTEWGPILAKIRSDPPALIVNTDYIPTNEATFIEQFLENPTNTHIFMQYGPSTPEFIELLGDKSTGVIYNYPFLSPWVEAYTQGGALLEKFKERWDYEPGMYGPAVYSQVMMWAAACERVGDPKDHLAVGENLGEFTAFWGPYGLVVFDPATHLSDSAYAVMTFYQIWDGKRFVVDPKGKYCDAAIKPPPWWKE